MGDYLETIVSSSPEWDDATKTTKVELQDWRYRIQFELPIKVHFQVGDRIVFYQGCLSMRSELDKLPRITYTSAAVYRAPGTMTPEEAMKATHAMKAKITIPENWTRLMEFDSRDMELLTEIHKYAESFMGEQIQKGLRKEAEPVSVLFPNNFCQGKHFPVCISRIN
jgi:hypothetical protein